MTRLLALVQKPTGLSPGQRFRLEQWAPLLRDRHGIGVDFCPFESPRLTNILPQPGRHVEKAYWLLRDTIRRRAAVSGATKYDGVIVYREAALLGPAIYERILRRRGVPLYLDFDDAIWMPTESRANGFFSRLHFASKTKTICRIARAVTVGNEYLASFAKGHNPATFVVPTSIDLTKYRRQPPLLREDPFIVVWSGSVSTLVNLEALRVALARFGRTRRVVLRVIGNRPPETPFENVENVFVQWQERGEAETIAQGHVGVMPLQDEPFMRGKCGLKALQYMAVGLPVVASPVGVNSEIIAHRENGLLATTDDEWVEALDSLARSHVLRERVAAAARRTVEARYSSDIAAALFAKALQG